MLSRRKCPKFYCNEMYCFLSIRLIPVTVELNLCKRFVQSKYHYSITRQSTTKFNLGNLLGLKIFLSYLDFYYWFLTYFRILNYIIVPDFKFVLKDFSHHYNELKLVLFHAIDHIDHSGENITSNSSMDVIIHHCKELYQQHFENDTADDFLTVFQDLLQGTVILLFIN